MDRSKLIGKKVKHVTWGIGTIISIKGNYVEIAYNNGEQKKYLFPMAFQKFLRASERDVQKEIEEELYPVQRKKDNKAQGGLASKGVVVRDHSSNNRSVKDTTIRLMKNQDAQKNDIGNSNRVQTSTNINGQKEGSPAWFGEQAAKTEHLYHLRKAERVRENFIRRYSPEKLAQMNGEELLQKVFGSEDSMLYELTSSKSVCNIFGAASHYKYLWIVYSTKPDQWNYYRGGRSRTVIKQEAMQKAIEIRDLIVRGASIIAKHKTPNSIADYRFLEQDLSSIFIYSYTWVLKYFQMLYPGWFPCMYGDHTLVRAIGIIGLPEHGDRYLNLGEIALFTKKCGIPNVLLSHIYGLRWGWAETLPPCENAVNNFADSRLSVSEYNRRNA